MRTASRTGTSRPAEGPAPGAETPTKEERVEVTGNGDWQLNFSAGTVTGIQEMSDQRVSGDVYVTWRTQYEHSTAIGDCTIWGAKRITNDEGAWEGEYIAFVDPDGRRNIMGGMQGREAYDGLTYIEQMHGPPAAIAITGHVYPGHIPPTVVLGMDGPQDPVAALPAD